MVSHLDVVHFSREDSTSSTYHHVLNIVVLRLFRCLRFVCNANTGKRLHPQHITRIFLICSN